MYQLFVIGVFGIPAYFGTGSFGLALVVAFFGLTLVNLVDVLEEAVDFQKKIAENTRELETATHRVANNLESMSSNYFGPMSDKMRDIASSTVFIAKNNPQLKKEA